MSASPKSEREERQSRRGEGTSARESRAATSAGVAEPSCSGSRAPNPRDSESVVLDARGYVKAILELYLRLPGTPRVTSRHDRRCAQMLFRNGVPFDVVRAALMIAMARRTFRAGDPLPRVRALHYFLPVIEELQDEPTLRESACRAEYLRYLDRKLEPLAAQKARGDDPPQRSRGT